MGREESRTIAAEDARKSGRIHDRLSEADRAALHAARRRRDLVRARHQLSGHGAVHARHPSDRLPSEALDYAALRRVRLGVRHQPALQIPARTRADWTFDRLRFADADGL